MELFCPKIHLRKDRLNLVFNFQFSSPVHYFLWVKISLQLKVTARLLLTRSSILHCSKKNLVELHFFQFLQWNCWRDLKNAVKIKNFTVSIWLSDYLIIWLGFNGLQLSKGSSNYLKNPDRFLILSWRRVSKDNIKKELVNLSG